MNKDKVFGSVFMIVGALVIVIGIVNFFSLFGDYRELRRFSEEALITEGTVTDFEIVEEYDHTRTDTDRKYHFDMSDTYEIMTITYTVDGREYSFRAKKMLTDGTVLFAKGDTIDIYYFAEDPENATLLTRTGGWEAELQNVKRGMVAVPLMCAVLGVAFIAAGAFTRKQGIAMERGDSGEEEDEIFHRPGRLSRFVSTLRVCFGGIVTLLFGVVILVISFVLPAFKQLGNESKVETVPAEVVYYGEEQVVLEYEVDGETVRGTVSSAQTGFLIEGQKVWIVCDNNQPDKVYLSKPQMDSGVRSAAGARIVLWIFGGLFTVVGIYVIVYILRAVRS